MKKRGRRIIKSALAFALAAGLMLPGGSAEWIGAEETVPSGNTEQIESGVLSELETAEEELIAQEEAASGLVSTQGGEHKNTTTYEISGGKLYFDLDTGEIYWADGDMKELTIPEKIQGKKVKNIYRWGLSGLKKLKKVTLPNSMKNLGEGALAGVKSLQKVVFAKGMQSLGEMCFYDDASLEEITIPNGISVIPESCFYNCKKLKKVSMPSTTASIGDMAFYNCASLEYADIPGNCMKLGKMAFYNCSSLKGAAFVEGSACDVSGWGIFNGCDSLEKLVNIPSQRFKTFYESGRIAEKWLEEPGSIEIHKEMWRLKYGTESDTENWISGAELTKREDEIRAKAEEVTKKCKTDRERVAAVMTWIVERVDYERDHDNHPWAMYLGIQDMEAGKTKKVLASCGGYSSLTQVMLQSLGIPCVTFWREARNGETIDHVFCAAYFEDKWRWLDTTHSYKNDGKLELDYTTPTFFMNSDHRVDFMLYRTEQKESIYKELPTDITVEPDKKDWPDQNPADAYEAGEAVEDPDWIYEWDPEEIAAEQEKIRAREAEFPSIPVSSESLFTFDKATGTITKYSGSDARINIPEKIGGVSVTAIGKEAFAYNRKLEYVSMPDTITTAGESAFSGCTALKRIRLSKALTGLSSYMFRSCDSLDSVTIPASVKKMGISIFSSCDSLEEALFEDHDFKVKVYETDPMGSDNNIESGAADISWYCFSGNAGRALWGIDFDESYQGTKYYKQLQNVELTDDWRQNIVNIHQSQMGYREGFSPYHLDGSNSKEFRLSGRAVDYEWGHFSESGKFTGINSTTWCRAFIEWAYAMAGVSRNHNSRDYLTEFQWEDTVYAGKGGTMELKPGDMLGMGTNHWCMVGSVKERKDDVEIWIIHGNHSNRQVMDEVRHYDKKTGIATDMDDDKYNYFRALYQVDFSKMQTRTVTLDAGEGSCNVKSRIYCEDAYYGCLPEAEPRDGYVFDGWFTKKDSTADEDRAYPYRNLGDGVTTLYAHYTYNPKAVKGLQLNKEKVTLGIGKQTELKASVLPADAENTKVIWYSANSDVVTVKDGKLKGVSAGKATIVVRTKEGPYVAYCEVNVKKDGGGEEEEDPGAVTIKADRTKVKYKELKAADQTVAIEVSGDGEITATDKSKKKLQKFVTLETDGRIVYVHLQQGAKKGTYKIRVEAAAGGNSKAAQKTIKIKVK